MNSNTDLNNNLIKSKKLNYIFTNLLNGSINLDKLEDLNYVDDRGCNLVLLASIEGNLRFIKLLLETGNVIISDCYNRLDAFGDPLHVAIKYKHLDLVRYLIEEKKVLLDNFDSHGRTPLYYSIQNGDCDLFSYLIRKGSNFKLVKDNPLKLAVNSLNVKFINLILPFLDGTHFSTYCPITNLAYSYTYPQDLKKKLITFDSLLKNPKIKIQKLNANENLQNLVKFNKFRFLKLLILNNIDIDLLNLDDLFLRNICNSYYCDKLLIVLKLNYYLGLNFRNVNKASSTVRSSELIQIIHNNNFNSRNFFFGDHPTNEDQTLVHIHRTTVFQDFLNWLNKKPKILNLQLLSRIALRKQFHKNLIPILNSISYPNYLIEFLNLDDLQDYLQVLDL